MLSINFSSVLREEGVVLCTFRDVTRSAPSKPSSSRRRTSCERVIDSSVDAIISADLKGRVLLFNRAAERIYGIAVAEIIGARRAPALSRGHREGRDEAHSRGRRAHRRLRTEILDARRRAVPGVALGGAPLRDGEPVGTVGIFTDLREKMRMEQRLAAGAGADPRAGAAGDRRGARGAAAHELNQPLTSVVMYAELLMRRVDPTSPACGHAEVICNEAERMAEIVRKIGKITKYETKAYVGQAKILDLDKASEEEPKSHGGHPPPSNMGGGE